MNNDHDEKARKKLGNTLRAAREKGGLTQAEVAEKTGITANYYAMAERGEVNPSFDILRKLFKLLKISPSKLPL